MANSFEWTSEQRSTVVDAFKTFLNVFGKNARLMYPPRMVQCTNCWTKDTIIFTDVGPKPIQDIMIGDQVITPQGNTKLVTNIFANLYNGNLYNIKCYGINTNDWITETHKLLVIKNFRKHFTQKEWYNNQFILQSAPIEEIEAKDIKCGDALIIPNLPTNNIELKTIMDNNYGEIIIDDDLLYMLGWWIAEGCLNKSTCIRSGCFCLCASKEEYVADKLINIIKDKFGLIATKEFRKDADNLLVRFHSTKLSQFLMPFGLRSENKNIPDIIYNKLSNQQLLQLIHAYACGDGHIQNNLENSVYNRHSIGTTSKKLAYQIFQTLHKNGLVPSISTVGPKIDKNNTKHQRSWTVTWVNDRIQQKSGVRRIINGYASIIHTISTKQKITTVYNIEVDDEHEYIANGIASKNCTSDPIGNKPSVRWRTGGPMQYPVGSICPMCEGKGRRADEQTEDLTLLCNWDAAKFIVYKGEVRVPYGIVEVKGLIGNLPKIKKAVEIILQTPLGAFQNYRFKTAGEATDIYSITQGEFFVVALERAG